MKRLLIVWGIACVVFGTTYIIFGTLAEGRKRRMVRDELQAKLQRLEPLPWPEDEGAE